VRSSNGLHAALKSFGEEVQERLRRSHEQASAAGGAVERLRQAVEPRLALAEELGRRAEADEGLLRELSARQGEGLSQLSQHSQQIERLHAEGRELDARTAATCAALKEELTASLMKVFLQHEMKLMKGKLSGKLGGN